MGGFLGGFEEAVATLADATAKASIKIYDTVLATLRPTPARAHYTFNLRDLSKVFQGILMMSSGKVKDVAARCATGGWVIGVCVQ